MRELILLRHAKSSWDDPRLDDFDRPLAPRGRRAAPLMGREIARRGWLPEQVMVSAARRAWQTWRLVASVLAQEETAAKPEEGLYMASPETLVEALRRSGGHAHSILLVGHNPGLETFAGRLCGAGSDEDAKEALLDKFPTAAVARFEIEAGWAELDFGAGRLTHFLRPKDFS
ncbi:SixA phosphatase family protein [Nitratireductor indicus]|uniref:SixA phosphatase family protein n=1 Tax=Nitratireductor indicus TaxID=721133 RepID=UPI002874980F|nr:histidine phosphatase family protein [Nitratireductor indicus]MDS1135864.1 histidine phosphatase family protein [Nitratireductor indicus]